MNNSSPIRCASLFLVVGLLFSSAAPQAHALNKTKTALSVAFAVYTAFTFYLYKKKKTPTAVLPKDDSLEEQVYYILAELVGGEIGTDDRYAGEMPSTDPSKISKAYYEKVAPRGFFGKLNNTLDKAVTPTAKNLLVLLGVCSLFSACKDGSFVLDAASDIGKTFNTAFKYIGIV